jgi:hypothetical protein
MEPASEVTEQARELAREKFAEWKAATEAYNKAARIEKRAYPIYIELVSREYASSISATGPTCDELTHERLARCALDAASVFEAIAEQRRLPFPNDPFICDDDTEE